MAHRADLIITETFHSSDTLNVEHAHAKYTLMVGTTTEYHNHNILNKGGHQPRPLEGIMLPSIIRGSNMVWYMFVES